MHIGNCTANLHERQALFLCHSGAFSQRGSAAMGPSSARRKAITCITSSAFRRSGASSLSPAGAVQPGDEVGEVGAVAAVLHRVLRR
jgi:hypothetical protein